VVLLAVSLANISSLAPIAAHAEARVTGNAGELSLAIDDSTLQGVLATLSTSFALRYRSSIALSRSVSGTYNGSLRHVVARLLAGYDFFLRDSGGVVEVVVVGLTAPKAAAAVPALPAATATARGQITEPHDR
jgi:hypothetical protein